MSRLVQQSGSILPMQMCIRDRHLSDKHHDYLQAFLILKECEQYELMHKDNPHALFSIYHWMSNLAIFIEPQQFEFYKEKALSLSLIHISIRCAKYYNGLIKTRSKYYLDAFSDNFCFDDYL